MTLVENFLGVLFFVLLSLSLSILSLESGKELIGVGYIRLEHTCLICVMQYCTVVT